MASWIQAKALVKRYGILWQSWVPSLSYQNSAEKSHTLVQLKKQTHMKLNKTSEYWYKISPKHGKQYHGLNKGFDSKSEEDYELQR